ncbi:MAG: TonB-dependent receptor plug domain-containing protein, partial [Terriglobales bacterium]
MRRILLTLVLAAPGVFGYFGIAKAQSVPTEDTTADSQTPSPAAVATLEEITVTARRREEELQNVPESVSVVTGKFIEDHPISNALDLMEYIPTLNVNSGNSLDVNRFSIRGQGQITFADPGVVAYFAEVPLASGGAGAGYYYDLENVQVL